MVRPFRLHDTHPYAFGVSYRDAARRLTALQAAANAGALVEAVCLIAAYCPLHDELVARLVQIDTTSAVRRSIAAALARYDGWNADHRSEIGLWLDALDLEEADDWLADLRAYPCSDGAPAAWRVREWRAHRDLPAVLLLMPEELARGAIEGSELSDREEYFLAHRAFASQPGEQSAALRLLRAARHSGAESVIAALFASGRLDLASHDSSVAEAFHALPWSTWGALKQRYCADVKDPTDIRLRALVLWTRGSFEEALRTYGEVSEDADPAMLREYGVISVAAGIPVAPPVLERLSGYEAEWLRQLSERPPRNYRGLAELAALTLPPPDDPLFAMVVAYIHRQLARATNTEGLLADFTARTAEADPAWPRHVPHVEREYAAVWKALRSCDGAALAAALLERLLLVPVDLHWLETILRHVQGFPPEWFTADEVPAPMGDMITANCIRIVEQLEANGIVPNEEQQRWLCSGQAAAIVQTTLNLIGEQRGRA